MTAGTSSPLTDGASAVLVLLRGLRRERTGSRRWRAIKQHRRRRLRARDHGHRPGARDAQGARARRPAARRHRRGRAQRGVRRAGARLHARRSGSTRTSLNLDGGAIALGHPLGATGRAHHRQGGGAPAARGQVATRSPPSASAAARASPPCSRRSDAMEIRRVAVIGAGRDGRRHRRARRQRRRAGAAARHRAGRAPATAARSPRGAIERMLKAEPAPFMTAGRGAAGHPGQSRGRPRGCSPTCDWIVEAVVEERRRQAGALRAARAPCASRAAIVSSQHLDHPARAADRGPARELRARLPDHPLLQSAALHAAARGGRRPDDAAGGARGDHRASPISGSARASCAARTRRASSPTASAPTGCRRRSIEAIELGLTVEEADAVARQPVGHSQDRRLRPARSGRHRPGAARRRQLRAALPADDRTARRPPRSAADRRR